MNHRILVVDDNEAIHGDFQKILGRTGSDDLLDAAEAEVFGHAVETSERVEFELSFASQGQAALELVQTAAAADRRFAVVFMDVRMPPGWDGLETTEKLWSVDPDLQVVICTAYSDKTWEEMMEKISHPERLLILKKPFDPIEVLQLAHALTEKWSLLQSSRRNLEELERTVSLRTRELMSANARLQAEAESHRATASALRASEREVADFFENASVGLLQIGPDGRILRVNQAEIDLLGYAREDYLGHSISEFHVDPESAANFLQRLLAGETVHGFEARLRCRDGTIKHVLIDSNSRWEDGKFLHARCFTRDNTARKEAEASVREQAALLDKAQDAIFVRDLEDRVLYWSRGAERLYGWTAAVMMGERAHERLCVEPEKMAEARRETLASGEWSGELKQCTASEQDRIVESRWSLVRDDRGEAKSILVINTDVTEQRLLQAKFLRAQRLESIGTLAGGIAHDLNNILQPISLAMDLFRLQLKDPASLSTLDLITSNAQRATALIKQVLSFARGVEGERTPVLPAVLVGEVASFIRETFPSSIELQQKVADPGWTLLGDPTQLHQVLLNLCLNARDAMPAGGTLTIATENRTILESEVARDPELTAGRYAVFRIADTGTGIPEELRERIFDPFFTTKEQGKGPGLGLPTVLSIVRSHQGFIKVSARAGGGTEFLVFLPAAPEQPKPLAEAPANSSSKAIAGRGNGELILVVDDDAAILKIMGMTLTTYGYRVLLAADGAEGLQIYEREMSEIAVVISDMVMPKMDGPAMVAAIKALNPEAKVITTTGMSSQKSLDLVAHLGVARILPKPCGAQAFLLALREVISGLPPS